MDQALKRRTRVQSVCHTYRLNLFFALSSGHSDNTFGLLRRLVTEVHPANFLVPKVCLVVLPHPLRTPNACWLLEWIGEIIGPRQ
jgi:hypothetical protein